MPPRKTKATTKRKAAGRPKSKSPAPTKRAATSRSKASASSSTAVLPSAGFLLTCDPATKQYIRRLDDLKSNEKKFLLEDLDETHLLVKEGARGEIMRKVEDWMNENVWTNIEAKGDTDP